MRNFLLYIFIFCLTVSSAAQNLAQLEKQFDETRQKLTELNIALDSLRAIYDSHTHVIDREKSRPKPDKDKLAKLMSQGLAISDKLGKQEKDVSNLQDNLSTLKKKLNDKYSLKIDSLQSVLNSKGFKGDKGELEARILQFAEKRLLVSPTVGKLSFDPGKILQIQFDAMTDSLDVAIYSDYLRNALRDIDGHLSSIRSSRKEFEEIVTLQEKTSEFLRDVSEEQNNGIYLAAGNQPGATKQATLTDPTQIANLESERSGVIYTQFQSYLDILFQLNWKDQIQQQSTWTSPVDSTVVNLTLEDYLQLLKDVERELNSYKKIITAKLKY
jgi:hypothetical protein